MKNTVIKGDYKNWYLSIHKEMDKLILEGRTLVILVDSKKRRPISIPDKHYDAYGVKEKNSCIGSK